MLLSIGLESFALQAGVGGLPLLIDLLVITWMEHCWWKETIKKYGITIEGDTAELKQWMISPLITKAGVSICF